MYVEGQQLLNPPTYTPAASHTRIKPPGGICQIEVGQRIHLLLKYAVYACLPSLVRDRVGGMTRISKECSGLASLAGGQEGSWKG